MSEDNQILDLNEGADERVGYIIKPESPANGYVKDVYLLERPTCEESKNGNMMLVFKFGNKDGGTFRFNFMNPAGVENPKVRGMKMQQIKHLVSAFISTPYIDKITNGIKVKVKPELANIQPMSFSDLCEFLSKAISDNFELLPCTVKLVGGGQFPLVTPFVANSWNKLEPAKHFSWNPLYDSLEDKSKPKTDSPDAESEEQPTYA
jgi:hypothetical protein